jgi:DNA polymerase III delta prime subunit
MQHSIWNEKYRPQSLEDLIIGEEQKQKFQEYVDTQTIPHIGLFGKQGSGKTTLAKIFVKNIDCDFLYLNATEDRSMDVIKEKVGGFASSNSFKPIKIVILDEASHILEASQVLLLNMMETFSFKTRFILTGNYPERLIGPLLSRLQCYELTPPTKPDVARHLSKILELENAEFDIKDLSKIINQHYPDIRSIINSIQKYTIDGKLSIGDAKLYDKDYKEKILKILSNPTSKSITEIRQILVDVNLSNYEELYKFLYKKIDVFTSKNIGEAIITIEEYRYRSTSRIDQEITICALLSKLLEITK